VACAVSRLVLPYYAGSSASALVIFSRRADGSPAERALALTRATRRAERAERRMRRAARQARQRAPLQAQTAIDH